MIAKLVFKTHGEGNLPGSSATKPRFFIYIRFYIYISHIWLNGLNLNVYTGVLEPEHTASGKDQNGQDC